MPRPRPPHLRHETTRHGRRVWYVRIAGQRIRLKAHYGTDEFWTQYHAAVNGERPQQNGKASAGTLAWLLARYRETPAWATLSLATRRQRENIFRQVIDGRPQSLRCDNGSNDCGGPGPQRQDAIPGTPFSRRHARSIRLEEAQFVKSNPAAEIRIQRQRAPSGPRKTLRHTRPARWNAAACGTCFNRPRR